MSDEVKTEQTVESQGVRVFVYGTLKRGHPNHGLLADGKAHFLGRCYVEGPFVLVNLTYYPGVVRAADLAASTANRIYGEVYRIDEEVLASLDILEGNGHYYTRSKVQTPWKNAWCYFLPESYEKSAEIINDGVWEPNDEEKEFIYGKTKTGKLG